jgi:hypothetical protein
MIGDHGGKVMIKSRMSFRSLITEKAENPVKE